MNRKERQRLKAATLISDWRRWARSKKLDAATESDHDKFIILMTKAQTLEECADELYKKLTEE
jgi:hypothetical protein